MLKVNLARDTHCRSNHGQSLVDLPTCASTSSGFENLIDS